MTERLLVKYAFADYSPGDRITDPDEMKRVSASHPDYVLRERLTDDSVKADPSPADPEPDRSEKRPRK